MPKRSPAEQFDLAIDALLGRRRQRSSPPSSASVAEFLALAGQLHSLPRPEFKARLKSDLQRRASMGQATAQSAARTEAPDFRPPGFPNIAPYFVVKGGVQFIAFLLEAFDGKERSRYAAPDGKIMHAEIAIGNSVVEVGDANEQFPGCPATSHLYVNDADATFARAIRAGAKSIFSPTSDHPSGDRWGALRDPFGNVWHIATPGSWAQGATGAPLSVQPYLNVKEAHKLIPFLESAFNARTLGLDKSPEGAVLHATVEISGATLEIGEAHGDFQPMLSLLHVYVPDPDTFYDQALRAGATTIESPQDKPYGVRSAAVKDAFGHIWYLARYAGVPQPDPGR